MTLAECKQLAEFPVLRKNTLRKWCRNLSLCMSSAMQVYQRIDVDVVPPASNFINSPQVFSLKFYKTVQPETPAQVLSCEYWEIFQSAVSSKNFTAIFLWIMRNFSTCNIIKNETPAQVLSREFWEIFQPTTSSKLRLWQLKFAIFLKSSLFFNSFYCLFCL